jgi:plastocyanin
LISRTMRAAGAAVALAATAFAPPLRAGTADPGGARFYLPGPRDAAIVSVAAKGAARADVTVLTEAVATKEAGPAEAVKTFGEVYAFSPETIIVHRDEPTRITFWNLQADDHHDFALMGADLRVLMYVDLPPLKKTSWVFTFHRDGLYNFKCMQHEPAMSGQFLVIPPPR